MIETHHRGRIDGAQGQCILGGEHFWIMCPNAGAGNTRAQDFKVVRKIVVYAKADLHTP